MFRKLHRSNSPPSSTDRSLLPSPPKVGQELMRPFGTDDDDIELNYILNRHLKAAFAMANDINEQVLKERQGRAH